MTRAMNAELRARRRLPMFEGCSLRQLKRGSRYCTFIGVEPGRVLHRRGERPDTLVVIVTGHALAVSSSSGLVMLGPGHCFGALARRRSAVDQPDVVIAFTAAMVATLTARELGGLMDVCPSVARVLDVGSPLSGADVTAYDMCASRTTDDRLNVG